MSRSFFIVCLSVLFLQNSVLESYQPYRADIIVSGVSEHVAAPNMVDLNRELKTSSIQNLIPIYTEDSPVTFDINLRGLLADVSFAANSTTLILTIPNSDITETFTGSTRDESFVLFKEFIKEGRSIKKILKGYARYSPIDPIAGNPRSLMSTMVDADYLLGNLSPLSGCSCDYESQPIVHQFQTGLNFERAFAKKFDTTSVLAPMRYSYSPNHDFAIIIDAPMGYLRNGGASSVFLSLGLGLRLPITHAWSLTTIGRFGSGGSLDLCTAGNFAQCGLVSVYNLKYCNYLFALTNYAGYIASVNFWLTGVNFNYHLKNFVYKNGIAIASCNGLNYCNRAFHFKAEFRDTYIANRRLFINHYDEVAVSLITTGVNPWLCYDSLTSEFAYQFGQRGYKGYQLNFIYQF